MCSLNNISFRCTGRIGILLTIAIHSTVSTWLPPIALDLLPPTFIAGSCYSSALLYGSRAWLGLGIVRGLFPVSRVCAMMIFFTIGIMRKVISRAGWLVRLTAIHGQRSPFEQPTWRLLGLAQRRGGYRYLK
ncbi:hypothetical protein BJ878DRAFT_299431 [Calycina marina]|uniref:Uncharacterized protein n=1 Tax=Calycina marina TaxID=1763456 RepID=A0A9P8CGH7_9HELO|nr:hypothetical protein BJ878DRAFT_299431 [Calycina marina]